MPFNLKIILAFSVHATVFTTLWILFNSNFLNRKCSFSIQLHPIESNWTQLNPIKSKTSIRYLKCIRIEKNFNSFHPFSFARTSWFNSYYRNSKVVIWIKMHLHASVKQRSSNQLGNTGSENIINYIQFSIDYLKNQ